MSKYISTKLGQISRFKQGVQIPVDEQLFVEDESNVRFIRIVNYTQKDSDFRYIDIKYANNCVSEEDIVVVRYGSIGTIGRGYSGVIANNLFQVIPNDQVDKNYLYYYLTSSKSQNYLRSQVKSGAMPALSFKIVEQLPIQFPESLDEQKKIAQILSTWDEAIEAVEELIEKKKKMKIGLFQNYFGNLPTKKLSSAAKIIMGQSPSSSSYNDSDDGLPFVGGNADISESITKPRFFTNQVTKKAVEGDIILTVRAPVGEVAKNNLDICIGRGVCAIRTNHQEDTEYLYQALKYNEKRWLSYQQGSTFTAVNSADIKKFPIHWQENKEERSEIASHLSQIDDEITLLTVKKNLFKKQKKGLMQILLTGKVKVN